MAQWKFQSVPPLYTTNDIDTYMKVESKWSSAHIVGYDRVCMMYIAKCRTSQFIMCRNGAYQIRTNMSGMIVLFCIVIVVLHSTPYHRPFFPSLLHSSLFQLRSILQYETPFQVDFLFSFEWHY